MNIAKYQVQGDCFIFNNDDERIKQFVSMMNIAGKLPFSLQTTLADGCYTRMEQIVYSSGGTEGSDLRPQPERLNCKANTTL